LRKVRTKTVPVVIGALGTIKKGLDHNLLLLPGHQPLAIELPKITLMSTAYIIRNEVNYCDLLVISGLARRPHLTTTRRE
jgi:hypothetical protein